MTTIAFRLFWPKCIKPQQPMVRLCPAFRFCCKLVDVCWLWWVKNLSRNECDALTLVSAVAERQLMENS